MNWIEGQPEQKPYVPVLVHNDRGQFVVSWNPDMHGDGEGWWEVSNGKQEMPLRGSEPTHHYPIQPPPPTSPRPD